VPRSHTQQQALARVPASREMMTLGDGEIAEYRETANVGPGFIDLEFTAARTAKIFAKKGASLKKRPDTDGFG
jgi:hypothetical protein